MERFEFIFMLAAQAHMFHLWQLFLVLKDAACDNFSLKLFLIISFFTGLNVHIYVTFIIDILLMDGGITSCLYKSNVHSN